ncbi:MAG TPA: FAD-binding oxidoreductase [Acidimicrobiales bacterium]|nr:FAD-binding oxidoreductase [Acidimicrobiales bacterium]
MQPPDGVEADEFDVAVRRGRDDRFRRPVTPERDIDVVVPPMDRIPVSRGAKERRLERTDRYDRRARVVAFEPLTPTGTVRISFEVIDDQPFVFLPGYFIGIRAEVPDVGSCRSPYCILSPPNDERTFQLIVRLVPEGPLSCYLAGLEPGDVISFRGPAGRCMIPKEESTALVMLATGVGIGPILSLMEHLQDKEWDRPVRLFWGLRLFEDICLVDQLDRLVAAHRDFSYRITLSQPPAGWTGLRGRVTESVPPLLSQLGGQHFYLVGNGAMIAEMSTVLSDLGVDDQLIYEEVYFASKYRPEEHVLCEIRSRFVAHDLFSPYAHQQADMFGLERPLSARRRRRY